MGLHFWTLLLVVASSTSCTQKFCDLQFHHRQVELAIFTLPRLTNVSKYLSFPSIHTNFLSFLIYISYALTSHIQIAFWTVPPYHLCCYMYCTQKIPRHTIWASHPHLQRFYPITLFWSCFFPCPRPLYFLTMQLETFHANNSPCKNRQHCH